MERRNSDLLISFLVIVIILGSWQFWVMFKDFEKAREQLKNAQFQIAQVNQEKEKLKSQLDKITVELAAAYSQLQNQLKKIANLETVNTELIRVKLELEQKVVNLEREKQIAEAKLHSLENLKIAIRQVKKELHEQKAQQYLAKKQRQKEIDTQKLEVGNHGFLVRYGKSTYKPIIRIEVKPVN